MSEGRVERRLAAILAADVVGYSRLMGEDEAGTLAQLRAHRRELIDPEITARHGRLVKTTGDGFLVEFGSVLDALRCATEIQQQMAERNADLPPGRRIDLRIGVNVGDVVVEKDDILGDGVNVAARLEQFAEPGGICVSARVQEDAAGRLPLSFVDLGDQQFKNIVRPVRVFALTAAALAASPKGEIPRLARLKESRSILRLTVASGALVLAVIAGAAAWWLWSPANPAPSTASAPGRTGPPPISPRRLSIVVLPFANLSDDPGTQHLADGITEDLTSDLSRMGYTFVISRTTATTYRDKPVKQIGQDLGVHYAVEGSVQPSGGQIRINAELIDTQNEASIWSQRYVADPSDSQTDIPNQIAAALKPVLVRAEAARTNANPDAVDLILQGRTVLDRPHTRESVSEAIGLFERALALDPNAASTRTELGEALVGRVLDQLTDTREADLDRADRLISEVLTVNPDHRWAHYVNGEIYRARSQWAKAAGEYEWVLARDGNDTDALHALSQCKLVAGALDEAIALEQRVVRLNPLDPQIAFKYARIGFAYLLQSKSDDAVLWLEKARNSNPKIPFVRAYLSAAYGLKGEIERAAAELEDARKLWPAGSFQNLAVVRKRSQKTFGDTPVFNLFDNTYFAGLRKAGLPDE